MIRDKKHSRYGHFRLNGVLVGVCECPRMCVNVHEYFSEARVRAWLCASMRVIPGGCVQVCVCVYVCYMCACVCVCVVCVRSEFWMGFATEKLPKNNRRPVFSHQGFQPQWRPSLLQLTRSCSFRVIGTQRYDGVWLFQPGCSAVTTAWPGSGHGVVMCNQDYRVLPSKPSIYGNLWTLVWHVVSGRAGTWRLSCYLWTMKGLIVVKKCSTAVSGFLNWPKSLATMAGPRRCGFSLVILQLSQHMAVVFTSSSILIHVSIAQVSGKNECRKHHWFVAGNELGRLVMLELCNSVATDIVDPLGPVLCTVVNEIRSYLSMGMASRRGWETEKEGTSAEERIERKCFWGEIRRIKDKIQDCYVCVDSHIPVIKMMGTPSYISQ